MKEQLITFDTAKLAKEKGFDIDSNQQKGYNENGNLEMCRYSLYCNNIDFKETSLYSAPTQSLLQRWLREGHGIHIQVYTMERWLESGNDMEIYFEVNLKTTNSLNGLSNIKFNMLTFKTYEEALETGLQEALKELWKNK